MIGSNNTILDSPSFIQKFLKKKSKYNIKPLYTSDVVTTEIDPWRRPMNAATKMATSYSFKRKTKTYNIGSPSLTNASSIIPDSAILIPPPPSHSTPTPQPKPRKRPTSAEILIKIMDQKLLKQQQQREAAEELPLMTKSYSATTVSTATTHHRFPPSRRNNKIIVQHNNTPLRRASSHAHEVKQYTTKKLKNTSSNKSMLSSNTTTSSILTQDNDEQDRMVAQHYLLRTAFGTDANAPIQRQLEKGIVVLDVGCGPGTWTMEMSTAFPKSTFIGIDQTACFPQDIKPRNCHFRTCGGSGHVLPFPDNSIDYIYQRDMNWSLSYQAWHPLLLEYQRILKPGGWLEFLEPDLETHNSLGNELVMNDKLITGLTSRQQDPYAVHRLPTLLSIHQFQQVENFSRNFPLGWGSSFASKNNNTNSSSISESSKSEESVEKETLSSSSSVSSSTKEPFCSEFARAMSSQYMFLLKSLKPWLSSIMELTSEQYDDYIAGLPVEWTKAKTYIKWHCILAQKPYVVY